MTEVDKIIRGKALKIYLLLLKKGAPMGVREIQRELHLSTPSLVLYHLNKLNELGVISKTENDLYYASDLVKSTYLVDFIKVKGLIFPRFLFYSLVATTGLIALLTVFKPLNVSASFIFAIIVLTLIAIFMWIETYRFWKRYFES